MFFFYVFIKFSSSVHLLLLFLNLFEGQTTVQNPLKNILRSCASSTTRDVAYILKNYHIRATPLKLTGNLRPDCCPFVLLIVRPSKYPMFRHPHLRAGGCTQTTFLLWSSLPAFIELSES